MAAEQPVAADGPLRGPPLNRGVRCLQMHLRQLKTIGVVWVLWFVGCGVTYREFDQRILVRRSAMNAGGDAIKLRYFSAPNCSGPFVDLVWGSDATASGHRAARRGKWVVLLEHPSLCYAAGDVWATAWQDTIDPPDSIEFDCSQSTTGVVSCKHVPASSGGT